MRRLVHDQKSMQYPVAPASSTAVIACLNFGVNASLLVDRRDILFEEIVDQPQLFKIHILLRHGRLLSFVAFVSTRFSCLRRDASSVASTCNRR